MAVVLTYNSADQVAACLDSLERSDLVDLAVTLVDNASTDGTTELLRESYGQYALTIAKRNQGFGAGCNLGIATARAAGAEYALLVNPDAVLAPDAARRLVEFMDAHPEAGAVGARTHAMTPMACGSPRLLYAGSVRGLLPLRQVVAGIERADTKDHIAPIEVDYVWGHGMLLRLSALAEVGGFDEDFFMYYEDLDLCRRIKAAGHGVWCEPSALMWHDALDGSRAIDSEFWRWRFKAHSMAHFHRKHYGALAGRGLSACTGIIEALQLAKQGRLRALGHQVLANVAHAFGMGVHRTQVTNSYCLGPEESASSPH